VNHQERPNHPSHFLWKFEITWPKPKVYHLASSAKRIGASCVTSGFAKPLKFCFELSTRIDSSEVKLLVRFEFLIQVHEFSLSDEEASLQTKAALRQHPDWKDEGNQEIDQ
jgi:hypothetical protein